MTKQKIKVSPRARGPQGKTLKYTRGKETGRTKRCRKQVVGFECWLFVEITSDVNASQLSMWPNARSLRALPRVSVIGASTVGKRLCASLAMLWSSDTRYSHILRPILPTINRSYIQCITFYHKVMRDTMQSYSQGCQGRIINAKLYYK